VIAAGILPNDSRSLQSPDEHKQRTLTLSCSHCDAPTIPCLSLVLRPYRPATLPLYERSLVTPWSKTFVEEITAWYPSASLISRANPLDCALRVYSLYVLNMNYSERIEKVVCDI